MSTVVSVALLIAIVIVGGNWVLEACERGARRHRALTEDVGVAPVGGDFSW